MTALAIDRICLSVPDLGRAEQFYHDALGFTRVENGGVGDPAFAALFQVSRSRITSILMRLGNQHLELLAFDPPGKPYPRDGTASDLWFQHCAIVVSDMAAAYAHLQHFDIAPITRDGPQELPPNTGSVIAYKFRDPFGHPLELLHFPKSAGARVWHDAKAHGVFLGIDHTAIAVADAAASIAFYESVLGFKTTARSVNHGMEQDRLDSIDDVRVDVVALSPIRQPPHLELLGYHTGTRRPHPADWCPADHAITHTIFNVSDFATIEQYLGSTGRHPKPRVACDAQEALALHDPDGHSLILRIGRPDSQCPVQSPPP